MAHFAPLLAVSLLLVLVPFVAAQSADPPSDWTIYVVNDNCPDYTWGLTEEQTRKAFADIVRAHLDEMKRTDSEAPENRDRYNMAVTNEALCFVEHYPDRKDELIRRIKEGRICVSPFLCNSLWAFQSAEGFIRTLYPARRLERDWGIPIDVAEHIELPSLPWGAATLLAGCGVRWLSVPFYNYDSDFARLKNPPLFILEGPDGSPLRVVMDPWASNRASYTQGAQILREPKSILADWLPHYRKLGDAYPLKAILASGTHGDISPGSGGQARGFADAIGNYNASPGPHPKLVNAALSQFCAAVDEAQAKKPFLPTLRGDFGHSWDLWPVSLAKYAADLREGERQFLAAEALVALASLRHPEVAAATRADRDRAEWCLAMLSDHAWNGTDERNKRHNADLRRRWAAELTAIALKLQHEGWRAASIRDSEATVTLFNPLSSARCGLARIEIPDGTEITEAEGVRSDCVREDGRRLLYAGLPIEGFGLRVVRLRIPLPKPEPRSPFHATPTELAGPHYSLKVDPKTGGIASLVHRPTGTELVAAGKGRSLCQSVYHDGSEHPLADVKCEVAAAGQALARLRITGRTAGIEVTNLVTIYTDLDQVDFDVRIKKPAAAKQDRLCQFFPLLGGGAVTRIETPGAVICPKPQPEGDLLPGADLRRFAVQGFVDLSLPDGPGVTIVALDAFLLRTDLGPLAFECLGNDQNYREVVQDQNGVTEFRFRYALRFHAKPYDQAETVAWSHGVAAPLLVARGGGLTESLALLRAVDPARAIALCLKPADDPSAGGVILRLWETSGRSGPFAMGARGYSRAFRTDLLERNLEELKIVDGKVILDLRAHGFAAVRLIP